MASPIPIVVTNANGQSLSITGATSGTQFGGPTPVVLCDINGNVLNLSASGGGMTWPSSVGIAYYAGSSAWGTSLTTSGSGTVVALTASPTFTGTLNGSTADFSTVVTTALTVNGALTDGTGAVGINGQVLSSTVT